MVCDVNSQTWPATPRQRERSPLALSDLAALASAGPVTPSASCAPLGTATGWLSTLRSSTPQPSAPRWATLRATRADPWSYKPLLQSALTGLVPSEVFARRTKGDYSAEDYRGARRAITELRTLLRDSRLADLGVIEPGPVLAALDRMVTGIGVPLGPLNTLLATELWLRTMNDGREGVLSACSP